MTSCHNIPQLALVFIIGIARNADQLDAVGIAQRAAKIPAVLPNQRFCRVRFFDMQSAPGFLIRDPTIRSAPTLVGSIVSTNSP